VLQLLLELARNGQQHRAVLQLLLELARNGQQHRAVLQLTRAPAQSSVTVITRASKERPAQSMADVRGALILTLLPASVLSSTDAASQCLRLRCGAVLARDLPLDGATAPIYSQPITMSFTANQSRQTTQSTNHNEPICQRQHDAQH